MAWPLRGPGSRKGSMNRMVMDSSPNLPPNKPREEKKQMWQSEIQDRKKNTGAAGSLNLYVDLLGWCARCLLQPTNIKWSKKPTEQRQSQICSCYCFLFSLLQKVIINMHADAKINKGWSFITWFSSWCKTKYLLVAPVAIALCVATLAHLAGFYPEHFCKWKTFCVVY